MDSDHITIELPPSVMVKDLAEMMSVTSIDVIKELMRLGVMASINNAVPFQIAEKAVGVFGYQAQPESKPPLATQELNDLIEGDDATLLQTRPPVVTILGHVDHGKTTLLDAIRKSHVAEGELGGITQQIGAYQVQYGQHEITFLDTPGHEAFTAMRARGTQVTDIVVLVVAVDDGVMPQTIEAINHARAAKVSIIVAMNKVDKPDADIDRVKRQLGEAGLILEEWGGDVITVPVSATKGDGIEELLENIQVVSEVAELKANPDRPASGSIIEAKRDIGRGSVATALVQDGKLRIGDILVAGSTWGKIRAMFSDVGQRVKEAGPSTPVEILGLNDLPEAGDRFRVMTEDKEARKKAEETAKGQAVERRRARAITLDEVQTRIKSGEIKELGIVLKTDAQGSIDAIRGSLERLSSEHANVRIVHAGSGSITETDILLSLASKAIILGFRTRPEPGAKRVAQSEGVEIRLYSIIYELIDDVQKILLGILEPDEKEIIEGHGQILAIFGAGKKNKAAGCRVIDGRIHRGAKVRVLRQEKRLWEGTITSLRHFTKNVSEMAAGAECGVGIDGFNDFQEGDVLEIYRTERNIK